MFILQVAFTSDDRFVSSYIVIVSASAMGSDSFLSTLNVYDFIFVINAVSLLGLV